MKSVINSADKGDNAPTQTTISPCVGSSSLQFGEQDDDDDCLSLPFVVDQSSPIQKEDVSHSISKTADKNKCKQQSYEEPSLPGLEFSGGSSRTGGESQSSSGLNSSIAYDSHYLDTAAALLASGTSTKLLFLGGGGSTFVQSSLFESKVCGNERLIDQTGEGSGSLSKLPYSPDNANKHSHTAQQDLEGTSSEHKNSNQQFFQAPARLPILLEEQSVASASSFSPCSSFTLYNNQQKPSASNGTNYALAANNNEHQHPQYETRQQSSHSFFTNRSINTPADGSTTILPAASPLASDTIARILQHGPANAPNSVSRSRRLASLAGATAHRTGNRSFQVSIDVSACSIQSVMDIVGNPELLRLWCDPLMSGAPLVVTKSSEGARTVWNWCDGAGIVGDNLYDQSNSADANLNSHQKREYEGEWVEATTTGPVIEPAVAASIPGCVYRTTQIVSSVFGCPQYGKVSMFVERLKGQVSLTIGPFLGRIEVHHNIRIVAVENTVGSKVRIVDDVRLRSTEDDYGDGNSLSSLFYAILVHLEQCWIPKVEDHIDQVVSSMARLRFLVENGASGEIDPRDALSTRCAMEHRHEFCDANTFDPLSTPLLNQIC